MLGAVRPGSLRRSRRIGAVATVIAGNFGAAASWIALSQHVASVREEARVTDKAIVTCNDCKIHESRYATLANQNAALDSQIENLSSKLAELQANTAHGITSTEAARSLDTIKKLQAIEILNRKTIEAGERRIRQLTSELLAHELVVPDQLKHDSPEPWGIP